jgi:hypothetical protein
VNSTETYQLEVQIHTACADVLVDEHLEGLEKWVASNLRSKRTRGRQMERKRKKKERKKDRQTDRVVEQGQAQRYLGHTYPAGWEAASACASSL